MPADIAGDRLSRSMAELPIRTNYRLASLLRVAVSGEGRPTGNVEPIFTDLDAAADQEESDRGEVSRTKMGVALSR
jgi:hypothetical protein